PSPEPDYPYIGRTSDESARRDLALRPPETGARTMAVHLLIIASLLAAAPDPVPGPADLATYESARAGAGRDPEAPVKLALWCEEAGLKAEAAAHLATVVRLEPSRDAAWRRLGFKKVSGRWVTDEQVTAAREEAEAQKRAYKEWQPLLTTWRGWLGSDAH